VQIVEFVTKRDLMTTSKLTWEKLEREGELVITNNGKPAAIVLRVSEGDFENTLQLIRQTRAMRLLNSIWSEADARGALTDDEIEAEIAAARAETPEDLT
jgi:PHD/YefM family antitoxin component YafN of YafNO toxin-antitoxin module